MIDYHNHTTLCKHAKGKISQYVERAIELGISEIAFTDHGPLPEKFDIDHRMNLYEMDKYMNWIHGAQRNYPEIKILAGIEMDYYEGFEKFTENFLKKYDFDIVIMTVHFIKNWPDGNWVFNYDQNNKTVKEIYKDYLHAVIKGIDTGLFDVVGHIDLIKKADMPLLHLIPNLVNKLLNKIKETGMVIEINTSGFRRKISDSYPGLDWIDLIIKFDIPICIGSDAHSPEQVGLNFNTVYNFIKEKGINKIACFDKRKIKLQKI